MTCKEAQILMVESQSDPELDAHIANCASCRRLVSTLERLRIPPAAPKLPEVFQNRLLGLCGMMVRSKTSRGMHIHVASIGAYALVAKRLNLGGIVLALAMGVYFGIVAWWLAQQPLASAAKWMIGIFIVQNVLVLLFSPVVFFRFRHLQARL